jgi:hypothetical protein
MDDPADLGSRSLTHVVGTAALFVLVLGVLPIAWHASAVWQVLGVVVAAVYAGHAVRVVWRQAFSTAPEHLTASR